MLASGNMWDSVGACSSVVNVPSVEEEQHPLGLAVDVLPIQKLSLLVVVETVER